MKNKTFLFLAAAAVLLAVSCNEAILERTALKTAEDYQTRGLESPDLETDENKEDFAPIRVTPGTLPGLAYDEYFHNLPQQDIEGSLLLRGPWITYCELHLEEMYQGTVEIIHSNVPNYLGIEYDESMRNSFRNSNEPIYSELIVENSFEKYICEVCNKIRDKYMESITWEGKK